MGAAMIRTLVNRYQSGFSLEQPFYTNSEIFDFEWRHIWKRYWLFAGTTADIPGPGDYFVYNLQHERSS